MISESIIAAFILGLMGAAHCFGMCGGITAALAFSIGRRQKKAWILLAYNLGRIFSYAAIGFFAGLLGQLFFALTGGVTDFPILRSIAALMLVLMGLYVAGWWKILVQLEKVGAKLWAVIQPFGQKFMPINSFFSGFMVGIVWGWLPCGLVYSALAYALTFAKPMVSSTVMLAFGLGTLPAVFFGGLAGVWLKTILQNTAVKSVSGILLIMFGLWNGYSAWQHTAHGHATSHPQHSAHSQQASPDHQNHHPD